MFTNNSHHNIFLNSEIHEPVQIEMVQIIMVQINTVQIKMVLFKYRILVQLK